jgi:hypothetical protein
VGILTDEMRRLVDSELGFVATVCPDGTPNLSPKGTTSVWDDDQLVFADLRSPGTVDNLRSNPSIEINVVDQLSRKGYRFKGTAAVHTEGDVFERGVRFSGAPGPLTVGIGILPSPAATQSGSATNRARGRECRRTLRAGRHSLDSTRVPAERRCNPPSTS